MDRRVELVAKRELVNVINIGDDDEPQIVGEQMLEGLNIKLPCPDCARSGKSEPWKSPDQLELHLKWVHLQYNPYECNYCKFMFTPTLLTLKQHLVQLHPEKDMGNYSFNPKPDQQAKLDRKMKLARDIAADYNADHGTLTVGDRPADSRNATVTSAVPSKIELFTGHNRMPSAIKDSRTNTISSSHRNGPGILASRPGFFTPSQVEPQCNPVPVLSKNVVTKIEGLRQERSIDRVDLPSGGPHDEVRPPSPSPTALPNLQSENDTQQNQRHHCNHRKQDRQGEQPQQQDDGRISSTVKTLQRDYPFLISNSNSNYLLNRSDQIPEHIARKSARLSTSKWSKLTNNIADISTFTPPFTSTPNDKGVKRTLKESAVGNGRKAGSSEQKTVPEHVVRKRPVKEQAVPTDEIPVMKKKSNADQAKCHNCGICGANKLKMKRGVGDHVLKAHFPPPNVLYTCCHCRFSSNYLSGVKSHTRKTHSQTGLTLAYIEDKKAHKVFNELLAQALAVKTSGKEKAVKKPEPNVRHDMRKRANRDQSDSVAASNGIILENTKVVQPSRTSSGVVPNENLNNKQASLPAPPAKVKPVQWCLECQASRPNGQTTGMFSAEFNHVVNEHFKQDLWKCGSCPSRSAFKTTNFDYLLNHSNKMHRVQAPVVKMFAKKTKWLEFGDKCESCFPNRGLLEETNKVMNNAATLHSKVKPTTETASNSTAEKGGTSKSKRRSTSSSIQCPPTKILPKSSKSSSNVPVKVNCENGSRDPTELSDPCAVCGQLILRPELNAQVDLQKTHFEEQHMLTLSGLRPLACLTCDATFDTMAHGNAHHLATSHRLSFEKRKHYEMVRLRGISMCFRERNSNAKTIASRLQAIRRTS